MAFCYQGESRLPRNTGCPHLLGALSQAADLTWPPGGRRGSQEIEAGAGTSWERSHHPLCHPQTLGPPHQAPHALPPQYPFQVSAESMRPGVAWLGLSDLAARGQTEMGSDSFHCFICEFKIRKERNPGKQLIAKQLTSGRWDPKLQARVSSGRGARTIWSQIPAPTRPGAGKGPHPLTSSLLH